MNKKSVLNAASGLLIVLLACTSCAAKPGAARNDEAVLEQRREALTRKAPARIPAPPAAKTVVGEVPDNLLDKVRRDLARRLGHGNMVLQRAAAVIWPSGALGCPVPGMVYTQAPVNGYQVIFKAEGQQWDYRLNERGGLQLCATPAVLRQTPQKTGP